MYIPPRVQGKPETAILLRNYNPIYQTAKILRAILGEASGLVNLALYVVEGPGCRTPTFLGSSQEIHGQRTAEGDREVDRLGAHTGLRWQRSLGKKRVNKQELNLGSAAT